MPQGPSLPTAGDGTTRALARLATAAALAACLAAPAALAACARTAVSDSSSKARIARVPLRAGVTYRLQPLVGPVPSADRFTVRVTHGRFPAMVAVDWRGGLSPTQRKDSGSRVLDGLRDSVRFEPIFISGEKNTVSATAPWVSRYVYERLAAGKTVKGFEEGGISLSGQVTAGSEGMELVPDKGRTFVVLKLDGKPVRIRAIGANQATFLIADDAADPLVLEYRTLGLGWRVVEVSTR